MMNTFTASVFVVLASMAFHLGESCKDKGPVCRNWSCQRPCPARGVFDRSNDIITTEAIEKLFNELDLNIDRSVMIKDLTNRIVDSGIDEERDGIEDYIRSVDNGDNQIDLDEFKMLIDNYAGLILNDHMDEIRSNTDFKNDMEKVRAAVQA